MKEYARFGLIFVVVFFCVPEITSEKNGKQTPAKVLTLNTTFTIEENESVKLPCVAEGVPRPTSTWKFQGNQFSSDRHKHYGDDSLTINDVAETDAGPYTCNVKNDFGEDSVTHVLIVKSRPHAPKIVLIEANSTSLTISLGPNTRDIEPFQNYTIHYKNINSDWKTVKIPSSVEEYTFHRLQCGTLHNIYVTSENSAGTSDPTYIDIKTTGGKPVIPKDDIFIDVHSDNIILNLNSWANGGCPLQYFVVEYKEKTVNQWLHIAKIDSESNYHIPHLEPKTAYNIRITAHNEAGLTKAEYDVITKERKED